MNAHIDYCHLSVSLIYHPHPDIILDITTLNPKKFTQFRHETLDPEIHEIFKPEP